MPDNNFDLQNQQPLYSFQGSSPADELLEIARIHHIEAKQLRQHALDAQAEEREEEAKLLMDLSVAREERALEFEKAARGEGGDPIVAEILDTQEEMRDGSVPRYIPSFIPKEDLFPLKFPNEEKSSLPKPIARILEWVKYKKP
jgi:hypothetical protein